MKKLTIALTERQAGMIRTALEYMTYDEEIGKGEYNQSWLKLSNDFDKKVEEAYERRNHNHTK